MKFIVKNSGFRILSHGRVGHFVSSALASVIFSSVAYALPQGAVVQDGSVSINAPNQNEMVINQTTQRAIIDWQSFSIAANEKLQIVQPSSNSMLLSRVVGNDPSRIFGQISANGGLMLINQNGILFGKDSKIDVASLVASTSNIRNEDFMLGKMRFMTLSNPDAKIISEGMITAREGGLVALVAPYVQNNGLILAKYGTVALAGAATATIDLYGDNLIVFEVTDEIQKTIINSGTIEASYVAMSVNDAKAVVDSSINMSGIVKAQHIDTSGGKVILTGGNIEVSGQIDADGQASGGEVRVITDGTIDTTQGYVSATGEKGGFVAFAANDLTIPDSSWSVASASGVLSDFGWYYLGNNISYASLMQNPNLSGSGTLSQSPTLFNENQGQFDPNAAFGAMGQKHMVVLSAANAAAYYAVNGTVTGIGFNNANTNLDAQGEDAQSSYSNYYINGVAAEGLTDYGAVRYKNLYNGVDLLYYTNKNGEIEHDLIVNAGANASQISYNYNGAAATKLANGDLAITNGDTLLTQKNPLTYQKTERGKHIIASEYQLQNDGTAKINVTDAYEHGKELIIDPVLSYATYFGGILSDGGYGIDTDSLGNVYIAGLTESINNIATIGASQSNLAGTSDAFLAKYSSGGLKQWATYFGGNDSEAGLGVAVDGNDGVYMAGWTRSTSGIATAGVSRISMSGVNDGYLVKFNTNGTKQWATYLGGDGNKVTVDGNGNVYATGLTYNTSGIAMTGTYMGNGDAFLSKFNTNGVEQWATYFGGSGYEYSTDIAVDGSGGVYITGVTNSTDNIATSGSYKTIQQGYNDGFLAKFNSSGTKLWATYYGGTEGDAVQGVSTDKNGDVYIVGSTVSTNGIATAGAEQTFYNGNSDGFLAKFNTNGAIQWGTYVGGIMEDIVSDLSIDQSGHIYTVGYTTSQNAIATIQGTQTVYGGGLHDAFLAQYNSFGTKLWATYLGGGGDDNARSIAVDQNGGVYITGPTASINGITTSGSSQPIYGGGNGDAFLAKFSFPSSSTTPIIDAGTQQQIDQAQQNIFGERSDDPNNIGDIFISDNPKQALETYLGAKGVEQSVSIAVAGLATSILNLQSNNTLKTFFDERYIATIREAIGDALGKPATINKLQEIGLSSAGNILKGAALDALIGALITDTLKSELEKGFGVNGPYSTMAKDYLVDVAVMFLKNAYLSNGNTLAFQAGFTMDMASFSTSKVIAAYDKKQELDKEVNNMYSSFYALALQADILQDYGADNKIIDNLYSAIKTNYLDYSYSGRSSSIDKRVPSSDEIKKIAQISVEINKLYPDQPIMESPQSAGKRAERLKQLIGEVDKMEFANNHDRINLLEKLVEGSGSKIDIAKVYRNL